MHDTIQIKAHTHSHSHAHAIFVQLNVLVGFWSNKKNAKTNDFGYPTKNRQTHNGWCKVQGNVAKTMKKEKTPPPPTAPAFAVSCSDQAHTLAALLFNQVIVIAPLIHPWCH